MPWYKQTSIWAVVISAMAIVLSQLPPVGSWIPSTKVSTEVGSRIGLPNSMGIPGFEIFIDMKNSGNKTLTISSLRLELKYPNGTVKPLAAQSYAKLISGQANSIDFPITSIALGVGASWSEVVSFYADLTPDDEQATSELRLKISSDIANKIQKVESPKPWVEAEQSLVNEAVQLFNKNFDLKKGQYTFAIKCEANGRDTMLTEGSFTLYNHHIVTIRSQTDDYAYGAGIYFPVRHARQVWVRLSK